MLVPGSGEDKEPPTLPTRPKAEEKPADPKAPPTPMTALPVELKDGIGRLGDPKSTVKLEVYFPGHSGCGSETATFADRVYRANKGKMQVVFVDFESPGGSKYQGDSGLHCSGVAINGKQQFEVKTASGDKRTVELGSNLGDRWDEETFLLALDVAFREAYGTPANHELPAPKKAPQNTAPKGAPPGTSPKMRPEGGKQ